MRIVFMGTPQYAATILENISYQHDVICVYTRPDAVRGRGNKPEYSPVKKTALELGTEVRTHVSLQSPNIIEELHSWQADCFVVAAYGLILSKEILSIPRFCCLNAHASLLPRWRGAAPIERAILAGDEKTGVCIMRIEEGLDTGPYCVLRSTEVGMKTTDELTAELADLASRGMLTALEQVDNGSVQWLLQDEVGINYAQKIGKRELFISADDTATYASRKVRAASKPHPSKIRVGGKSISLLRAAVFDPDVFSKQISFSDSFHQGDVCFADNRLFLCMKEGILEVLEVKPDGSRVMEGFSFASGLQGIKKGIVRWEVLD